MTAPIPPAQMPHMHIPRATDVVIVGGHTKVALRLTQLLVARGDTRVLSVFPNGWHAHAVAAAGGAPFVLSLEADAPETFAAVFAGRHVVYVCAGAPGGARKVCDALERVPAPRPRLVLLSARDGDAEDEEACREAERELATRTKLAWTVLRAAWLTSAPATGRAAVRRAAAAPLNVSVSRDDVACALALLVDRPEAAGLVIEISSGEENIEEALDRAVELGEKELGPAASAM